ncbi:MAG: hybrid sensor histidine kinase/response regulator, partial [Phenylobacterium sp.]|nr:hybrid sensor histidine kinase/response regulator [Phenylobacterium sp.]
MLRPVILLILAVVCSGVFARATAAETPGVARSPLDLAQAVERRAGATDFKALEVFGWEAMRRNDREGLQRLYHVAWIFLNQGEFETAKTWNDRL